MSDNTTQAETEKDLRRESTVPELNKINSGNHEVVSELLSMRQAFQGMPFTIISSNFNTLFIFLSIFNIIPLTSLISI